MDWRNRLFQHKEIYQLKETEELFVQAVRENVLFHQENCSFYRQLLEREGFDPREIKEEADCYKIPPIPASFFKYHQVYSIPPKEGHTFATSSGTQGQKSQLYFDPDSLKLGIKMAIQAFRWHGLISLLPTNYIMLGYEPSPGNEMGAVKTALGATRFAPALHKTFALRRAGEGYEIDRFGLIRALKWYQKVGLPVRLLGFPSYLYFLLKALREEGLTFRLNGHSKILLGGGWKQFDDQLIEKKTLYAMAEETLGIPSTHIRDFYSALEHSIPYCECSHNHFHVPIWSRVVIRDVKTLAPLGENQPGILSFITPLVKSAPLVSVMMGDLAILKSNCGCGVETPYFEVLGRAGRSRNCAIAASEWMVKHESH